MLMGHLSCQQFVTQSFNCIRKYLSPLVALAGLPFLIFTFSGLTKALPWGQQLCLQA